MGIGAVYGCGRRLEVAVVGFVVCVVVLVLALLLVAVVGGVDVVVGVGDGRGWLLGRLLVPGVGR